MSTTTPIFPPIPAPSFPPASQAAGSPLSTATTAEPRKPLNPEEVCSQLGWKVTAARRAIFKAIDKLDGYFDAEVLLVQAKKLHPAVSRATVYRTLPDLCSNGILRSTEFGDGHYRYCRHDPSAPPTAEIYVVDCGRILKVPAPFLSWYAATVTERAGYELIGQRLQTFARCVKKKDAPDACNTCEHQPTSAAPAVVR